MLRGALGIAHVMEAVEERDEIVVLAGKGLGRSDLEGDSISDASGESSQPPTFGLTVAASRSASAPSGAADDVM